MKKCPKCNNWTLDFDEYFNRYRCYRNDCSWMPASVSERQLRLLQACKDPENLGQIIIDDLDLSIDLFYDEVNDTLSFCFNNTNNPESFFEFPDEDPRILWSISRVTGEIIGFVIVNAKEFRVSAIQINIAITAKKELLSRAIQNNSQFLTRTKPTKLAIDRVAVSLEAMEPMAEDQERNKKLTESLFDKTNELLGDCIYV